VKTYYEAAYRIVVDHREPCSVDLFACFTSHRESLVLVLLVILSYCFYKKFFAETIKEWNSFPRDKCDPDSRSPELQQMVHWKNRFQGFHSFTFKEAQWPRNLKFSPSTGANTLETQVGDCTSLFYLKSTNTYGLLVKTWNRSRLTLLFVSLFQWLAEKVVDNIWVYLGVHTFLVTKVLAKCLAHNAVVANLLCESARALARHSAPWKTCVSVVASHCHGPSRHDLVRCKRLCQIRDPFTTSPQEDSIQENNNYYAKFYLFHVVRCNLTRNVFYKMSSIVM